MPRDKQIAILLPDTLQAFGLENLLKEYFVPVTVARFANERSFNRESADMFDFYFTDMEFFLRNIDFFLPRRTKTFILLNGKTGNTCQPPLSGNLNLLATDVPIEQFIEQIEPLLSTDAHSPAENNKALSSREINVLQQVVSGYTNKEIADHLNISLNTVLSHRKNITAKLGIKTVSGLTFYAIMNGYISGNEPNT